MSEEWTDVQSETWNPEEGEEISGIYLGLQAEVGENKSNLYAIETAPGKTINVWGSKVLDGKMLGVKVGQEVRIKFNGKIAPPGGKEYKSYDIATKTKK